MANLVVDIGNTSLKAAWADGITLGRTFRYQGERMTDFIISLTKGERPDILVVSSVRKLSQNNILRLKESCERFIFIDKEVLENHNLPSYLTSDRAASVIASRYLFKGKKCTVFDLGTIISADFIDEDGNYEGGVISPGCMTRFKSVNRYSKYLPLLDMPEDIEKKGLSLSSSICSGIISGIIFEIEGQISQNSENIVVFTGGDANYFAKRMKNSIFVVCNLVLMGLAITAVEYDKNS